MSKEVARGRVGLQNAGNTCFMNAALQCLLHAPELVFPFLETDENPIEGLTNNKYKMVREFAKLARNHYATTGKSQTTQGMRKSIKNIASYLVDGDQHDSHELLNFVLQGLEEELNRNNPPRDKMDSNVRPVYLDDGEDEQSAILEEVYDASLDWWKDYIYNNDCFISNVLYGQICNQIRCENCKKSIYNLSAFNTLYVPLQNTTISVTVTLILQSYSPSDNKAAINYFTLPMTLKPSDSIQLLDVRLHERLKAITDPFKASSALEGEDFVKNSKFVYLLRKQTSKAVHYTRLHVSTLLSEFSDSKNCSILVYFIPPTPAHSAPIFVQIGALEKGGQNITESTNPLDAYSMKCNTASIPILFSVPKKSNAHDIQNYISKVLVLSKENRITTNKTNENSIHQYKNAYDRIYLTPSGYQNSVFFISEETNQEEETTCSMKKSSTSETKTEENTSNAEIVEEKKPSDDKLVDSIMNDLEDKPVVQFPQYLCTALSSVSIQLQFISKVPELSTSSLSFKDLFEFVNAKSDYRFIYIVTRVKGLTSIQNQFEFDHCTHAEEVLSCFGNAVSYIPADLNYKENNGENEDMNKTKWNRSLKNADVDENKNTVLCLHDCLELKKPSTVILTGTKLEASSRKQSFGKEKIRTYVEYPLHDFDLSDYMLESSVRHIQNPDEMKYELQCVINHTGGADFGHYYAYCRDGYNNLDNWFEYNDSSVSAIRESEVVTKNAYILLYRRKDIKDSIYSKISVMNIIGSKGKKEDVNVDDMKEMILNMEKEKKLERERKDGVDNERKEGKDETVDKVDKTDKADKADKVDKVDKVDKNKNTDSGEPHKKRLSRKEQKELRDKQREQQKAERKRRR